MDGVPLIAHAIHEADDGAAAIEAGDTLPSAQSRGRQMAGVGVGERAADSVVVSQEQGGVLLRLGAAIEVAVEQGSRMWPGDSNSSPQSTSGSSRLAVGAGTVGSAR